VEFNQKLNEQPQNVVYITKRGNGMVAGIIACVIAVLGILTIGILFVPLAAIIALIGTIIAIKNKNMSGVGVNALAWVLVIFGFLTSPLLWVALGIPIATQ